MTNNKDKKILLIFPPEWYFAGPHIALPSLSAQLKKAGYKSEVFDLNIKFFNDILTKEYIENNIEKIKILYEELPCEKDFETNPIAQKKYLKIKQYIENLKLDKLPQAIEKAINIIKTPSLFKDIKEVYKALYLIKLTIEIIFFEHEREIKHKNYENIKQLILDNRKNIYYDYFSKILFDIKEKNADFIGISISSDEQAIAGLTLAYLLKKHTNTHINIGGIFLSHNPDVLKKYPEIFELFADSISLGEGEKSIIELAKYINGEIEIENISNIAYEKNGNVFINRKPTNIQLSELEIPDYSDINLTDYFSPFPSLPISMSRGCYWNKCSFCVLGYDKNYSEKPIDNLINELKFYKEELGISYFSVIDQCVTPQYLNKLCDEILKNKLELYFNISLRIEKEFDKPLLKKMFNAGFIRIFWGLESINQKTLNDMQKGINAKFIKKILKDSNDIGIWNFAYFIIGFPTESFKETLKTIDFIFENKKIISEYCCTPFNLAKNSICLKNPEKFKIKILENQEDFSNHILYEDNGQQKKKQEINKIIKEKNNKNCINYGVYDLISHYITFYLKIYGKKYLIKNKNKIL